MTLHQRLASLLKRRIATPLLRRLGPVRTVEIRGRRIRVDIRDSVIGRTLWLEGGYEDHLLDVVSHLDLAGSTCLDIGANIGLYSLALSQAVGAGGGVFAFEPERHNYGLLQANLRLNRADNVAAENLALGEINGCARLAVNAVNYGDHHVALGGEGASQEIPVSRVDEYLKGHDSPHVRFVKIDVQGYELHVLRGMTATLRDNPRLIVQVEVWPEGLRRQGESAEGLMKFLADLGFTGYEVHARRVAPVGPPWSYELLLQGIGVDCFFARDPRELRAAIAAAFRLTFPDA
jgi:FkbM family methyltransferase